MDEIFISKSKTQDQMKKSSTKIFYIIQMFLNFAQNLAFQFLPIYNRKQGATENQMGVLTAVQNVFSSIFTPFWGRKSDKVGRRVFLLLGGFIAFMSAMGIAIADTPNQIIFAVAINSIGLSMILPAWTGAIADYTEGKNRGSFFGRIAGVGYAYVTIALIIFTLGTSLLPSSEIQQYKIIMWISAINFGLVVVVSWFYIDINLGKDVVDKPSIFEPLRDPTYRRFLIIILFWWTWMSLAWSYFPIVVSDVADADVSQVAYLAIFATITQALSSFKLGDYIERIGVKRSMILGFLPFSMVPLFFAFATEWWHLILPQVIAGIGIGFGFTAMQTYIMEIAGSEKTGAYQGTYQILWGGVTFVGSLLGGLFLGWFKNYLGSLSEALKIALLGIFALRLLSNIVMVLFLPDIDPNINKA